MGHRQSPGIPSNPCIGVAMVGVGFLLDVEVAWLCCEVASLVSVVQGKCEEERLEDS